MPRTISLWDEKVVFVVLTAWALGGAEATIVGCMLGAVDGDGEAVCSRLELTLVEKSVRRLPSETTETVVQQLITLVLFLSASQVASSIICVSVSEPWPWKVTAPVRIEVVSLGSNSPVGVQSLPSGIGACPSKSKNWVIGLQVLMRL